MDFQPVPAGFSSPATLPSDEVSWTLLSVPLAAVTSTVVSTATSWAFETLVFTLTAGTSGVGASVSSAEDPPDTTSSASQALRAAAARPSASAPTRARLTRGLGTDVRRRPLVMRNSPWRTADGVLHKA